MMRSDRRSFPVGVGELGDPVRGGGERDAVAAGRPGQSRRSRGGHSGAGRAGDDDDAGLGEEASAGEGTRFRTAGWAGRGRSPPRSSGHRTRPPESGVRRRRRCGPKLPAPGPRPGSPRNSAGPRPVVLGAPAGIAGLGSEPASNIEDAGRFERTSEVGQLLRGLGGLRGCHQDTSRLSRPNALS